MQELVFTALVPHPPLLVPSVGGEEVAHVKATTLAMEQMAAELMATQPDTVVIISPHGPVFADAIAVHHMSRITGDFGAFGAPDTSFNAAVDTDLAQMVIEEGRSAGIPMAAVTEEWAPQWGAEQLDHGTMVPLYFLQTAGWNGPILPIAMGMLPPVQLYRFGEALQAAIDRSDRRIAVLASGDLSHRLIPGAPAGYHPEAAEFDRTVVEALGRGDLGAVFRLDPAQCERAGECGLRPLMMLAGTLEGLEVRPQVLSYEGPFGVGYAVVPIRPGGALPNRRLRPTIEEERQERINERRQRAHPVVQLARAALEHHVRTGMMLDFSAGAPHEGTTPWVLPDGLPERAGVFVSLKVDGNLRGCMGTFAPSEPTLALEIVRNAIMAASEDPRFSSVDEDELGEIDYTVDILAAPQRCTRAQLDPDEYGVIVAKGDQRGLLLPNLPGVDSADDQYDIACRKAGLDPKDPSVEVFRFQVQRFE